MAKKYPAAAICAGIIVAQIVLPATLDLLLSIALVVTAGWAGSQAGK